MRIEEIDKTKLVKASDRELLNTKMKFTQLWDKNFKENSAAVVGSLNRNGFLKNYKMLLDEMDSRTLEKSSSPIDKALFRKAMNLKKMGVDVSDFEDIVIYKDFIQVDSSFANVEEFQTEVEKQQRDFTDSIEPLDFEGVSNIPVYDLVLRAKQNTEVVKLTGKKKLKKRPVKKEVEGEKIFDEFVSVYPIDKADKEEHIVAGIVYEPDTVDAQGDKANEVEIRKAAYQFMEDVQLFKVNHKGAKVKVKALESYIAPVDFTIAGKPIKKGSWLLTVRVLSKKIWDGVKSGELTGFSMAGYAKAK